ncbi:hypothetical protein BO221_06440 [Archangium sp. Cb G35]|uniref:Kelch repeat-containing protein n=1 Tax=Archangium sp. Cb G35 TaxID=1920190 RepID=UPI00093688B8|nr:kelch repeat-containing protein [Archangium sp. Cb G35]OJT25508.1 hypothetical protein BO221_06440 [Archangium sp. Cb G35]
MKTTRLSLLLAGLASMAAGCQPETETPARAPTAELASRKAALTVGTWTSNSSSLLTRPGGHTATLLNGPGDVLVTDGNGSDVYNPYTNAWRRTASMTTARFYHTATELPSGKVLVAGGHARNDWALLSSAELYDPATGTWSSTGSTFVPRAQHTSVLLDSGKVLVAGGKQPSDRYGPIGPPGEVYDPETGTWTEVQGIFTSRSRTAATVLYSGKVLVTGGYRYWPEPDGFASAEVSIYDPATNSWSYAPNMARARHGHSAIRLYSGKVLVAGGISGGNTVELYDPYTNQWSLGPPLPFTDTLFFSATLLYSGEVLVTGDGGQAALYDPSTSTWNTTPNMSVGRAEPAATLLHTGEVLLVGGSSSSPRAVERFTR